MPLRNSRYAASSVALRAIERRSGDLAEIAVHHEAFFVACEIPRSKRGGSGCTTLPNGTAAALLTSSRATDAREMATEELATGIAWRKILIAAVAAIAGLVGVYLCKKQSAY